MSDVAEKPGERKTESGPLALASQRSPIWVVWLGCEPGPSRLRTGLKRGPWRQSFYCVRVRMSEEVWL